MCARRVYELSATKTAVVGMYSDAIRSVFGENEILLGKDRQSVREIFEYLLEGPQAEMHRRVTTQRAWRETLSRHTYQHRVAEIAALIGKPLPKSRVEIVLTASKVTENLIEDLQKQEFSLEGSVTVTVKDSQGDTVLIRNFGGGENGDQATTYRGYLDSRYRFGRHYLNDLVLALSQTDELFVAKSTGSAEEMTVLGLPDHGWLGRIGQPEFEELISIPDLRAAVRVYLSDPCSISLPSMEQHREIFDV